MSSRQWMGHALLNLAAAVPLPTRSPLERLLYRAIESKRRRGRDADALKSAIAGTFRAVGAERARVLTGFAGLRRRILRARGDKLTLFNKRWPAAVSSLRFRLASHLAVSRGITFDILHLPDGATIPPHGHNGVVSGMLVIEGEAGFRTYDVADALVPGQPARVVQRQVERCGPGGVSTSGENENLHWIRAYAGPLFLLRFTVSDLFKGLRSSVGEKAGRASSRLYLAPTGRSAGAGRIWAEPVDEAVAAKLPFPDPGSPQ